MISFLRRHRKSIFIATISVFLISTFVGVGGWWFTSRDMDGVVAKVGKSKIEARKFEARVEQYLEAMRSRGTPLDDAGVSQLRRELINDMVVDELLALKADELGLVVTDEELARDIRGTPAFRRGDQFDQDAYFRQVRAIFRESPREYEDSRRKAIKSARVKQLIYRASKPVPAEVDEAFAEVKKSLPAKESAKLTRDAVAQRLHQQRAFELINQLLRQVSAQVEHQIFPDRVNRA
jgi:hypothetical protein